MWFVEKSTLGICVTEAVYAWAQLGMKVSSTRYLSATTRPLKLRRTPRHFGLPCHFVSIMVSWLARTYSEGSVGRPLIFIPMLVGPKAIEYVFVIPHCYLCTLLIQNTFISFMGCFIIKLVSEAAFLTPMHTHQDTQQPDSWVMEMSPEINQWLPRSSGFSQGSYWCLSLSHQKPHVSCGFLRLNRQSD